jgi:Lar family restriction alleviation protein
MTKHKLCPFCGGEGEIDVYIEEQTENEPIWVYCVACYKCDVFGPSAYTEEEAWKAWDERAKQ